MQKVRRSGISLRQIEAELVISHGPRPFSKTSLVLRRGEPDRLQVSTRTCVSLLYCKSTSTSNTSCCGTRHMEAAVKDNAPEAARQGRRPSWKSYINVSSESDLMRINRRVLGGEAPMRAHEDLYNSLSTKPLEVFKLLGCVPPLT